MSVEGVPSVDDVLGAVLGSLHGPPVKRQGLTAMGVVRAEEDARVRRIAEAVYALYAPHLERATNREQRIVKALDDLALHDRTGDPYDEGYSAALADIRAALAEPKEQD